MNYLSIVGKESVTKIGKALKRLRSSSPISCHEDCGEVVGHHAAAWADGFCGPKLSKKWLDGGPLKRVILVSSQPGTLGETCQGHGKLNNMTPQRYGAAFLQEALQFEGFTVFPFSLPVFVSPGVDPQWKLALEAAKHAERMGCQAVVAVGDTPVLELGKAIAVLAHCDTRQPENCFWRIRRGTDAKNAEEGTNRLCASGRNLALVTVPTIPSGGIETSATLRIIDWENERRLSLVDPILQPDILCIDSHIMGIDNKKLPFGPFLDACLKWTLGNLLSILQTIKASDNTDAVSQFKYNETFHDIVVAARLAESGQMEGAYQTLGIASARIGDWLHVISQPDCITLHTKLALALSDNLPMRYDHSAAALLAASAVEWWGKHEWSIADALFSKEGIDRSFLKCDKGLLSQGVINKESREQQEIFDQLASGFGKENVESVILNSL